MKQDLSQKKSSHADDVVLVICVCEAGICREARGRIVSRYNEEK